MLSDSLDLIPLVISILRSPCQLSVGNLLVDYRPMDLQGAVLRFYRVSQAYLCHVTVLRTVPTIVTAHTFCTFRDTRVSYGWCLLIKGYFCAVKTMRRKQNLASALGIPK